MINDIIAHYQTGDIKIILGGFDYAGGIALRYTEMTRAHPQDFPVQPAAVFTADSFTDLFSLKDWCRRQIKKNYYQGSVGDAKALLNFLPKDDAALDWLTPFKHLSDSTGNERYLQGIPVRLYDDVDVEWQLKERHKSLYDTNIPDGSELVSRLLTAGNNRAELVTARQPGRRSNGSRNPNVLSIINETDFKGWGFKPVMDLLSCGKRQADDDNYFTALQKVAGITKADFNKTVWDLLKQFRTKQCPNSMSKYCLFI